MNENNKTTEHTEITERENLPENDNLLVISGNKSALQQAHLDFF